jgi:SOS-response transcriptional repressor LexA
MAKNYNPPEINQRFFALFKNTGLSQKEFGALVGVSQQQVSNIFLGKRGVTPMMIKLLEVKLNANKMYLLNGEGPMYADKHDSRNLDIPLIADIPAGPWEAWIDSYAPGAGEDYVSCPDLRGENLFAIRVDGDSMLPQLQAGDILVIDPNRRFKSGIAAVRHHWGYKIRTVRKISRGKWLLCPLNTAFEIEEITPDENTRLYVPVKVISVRDI